jgi:flagellar hook-associated protein 3 FlgL
MTRITESQLSRGIITDINNNRNRVTKYSNQISSGLKVENPGDSSSAGTLAAFQDTIERINGHETRTKSIKGFLEFQDNTLSEASNLVIRLKEIATQAANETVSREARASMAEETIQIRDHIVSLANKTYQGKYVFAGTDDDDPPYDLSNYSGGPLSTNGSQYYVFDNEAGTTARKEIKINEDITINVSTPANTIFGNAIEAAERITRALQGYTVGPSPTGTLNGTSTALSFPTEYSNQTLALRQGIDLLNTASGTDIQIERTSIGGRLRRVQTAESILKLSKESAQDIISNFQAADIAESATALSQAQTALQGAYTVGTQVLRQSILDYL